MSVSWPTGLNGSLTPADTSMLEIDFKRGGFEGPVRRTSTLKMPVDFTSYLLSSSPPGFEFYALRDKYTQMGVGKACSSVRSLIQRSQSDMCLNSRVRQSQELGSPLGSSTADSSSDSEICEKLSTLSIDSKPSLSVSGKKSVSFADEMGYSLIQVRVMTEPSNTPPRLRPELLASLTTGASAVATAVSSPPLVLDFRQPASDYIAFRDRLENNCVSLENVILKDYTLIGTVKVKNISFEKSVKVRVTYDGWNNFTDIACSYAPGMEGAYDTFSFDFTVPPNFDITKKVEFAVCFEANNQQFWDNNNGLNYNVLSSKWKSPENQHKENQNIFSLDGNRNWAEYSAWSYGDSSVPYY